MLDNSRPRIVNVCYYLHQLPEENSFLPHLSKTLRPYLYYYHVMIVFRQELQIYIITTTQNIKNKMPRGEENWLFTSGMMQLLKEQTFPKMENKL